jgi:hypothetical protein
VIPAVKAAIGLSEARAQLTFSISQFGMAFATLAYGSLSNLFGSAHCYRPRHSRVHAEIGVECEAIRVNIGHPKGLTKSCNQCR